MTHFQQAVFTSVRSERMDGYQVAAASDGVTKAQREELHSWGPAHDSLVDEDSRLGSINFHRLSCGTFCLSKTVPAGAEYSGRAGHRIYTTCLLATDEQMFQFANHPFRVLDAAIAAGHMRIARRLSDELPTVHLRGRASPALPAMLEVLQDESARRAVLKLAAAASQGNVLLDSGGATKAVLDQLFSIMPLECRVELSLTTGLKISPQRPFRIQPAPADRMECRTATNQCGAALVELNSEESSATFDAPEGWWATVNELLAARETDTLVSLLAQPRPEMSLSDLVNWSETVPA